MGRNKSKRKFVETDNPKQKKNAPQNRTDSRGSTSDHPPKKKKFKKEAETYESVQKRQLLEANEREEKFINRMENYLNLKKRKKEGKKLPVSFTDAGLDYILDVIDKKEGELVLSDCSDEFENDFAAVKGKPRKEKEKTKVEERPVRNPSSKPRTLSELLKEQGGEDIAEESGNRESESDDAPESDSDMQDEDGGDAFDESDNDPTDQADDVSSKVSEKKPKVREDIYGRLRDEEGNVIKTAETKSGLYVPPKVKEKNSAAGEETDESFLRIKRNLKGLLNRLSESNLKYISRQIEDLYMKNSRNVMNETLFNLMSDFLFTSWLAPPRLIMQQAMLVALLHANVGPEIGAYFMQHIVKKIEALRKAEENHAGKEFDNILTFLSHLYNFKVTHSMLIFDIFNIFIATFGSKDIELIQLLLKDIGFAIRKDDPRKLKDMISAIQVKATEMNKDQTDTRIKYMLEILMAIRNNNMYKIPGYDPSGVERNKKILKSFIREGCSIQEHAISYDDLLKADEKGRWWIVGSAWTDDAKETKPKDEKQTLLLPKFAMSEKILELARKQHMNTDIRKSIFCIIMTAEDFMDAFEKLLRLGLRNQQEREIIHVILHCSLQEKKYNPYYAFLLDKFCTFNRKHRMCLQFSLWDKFKEFSNLQKFQLENLASLLIHLFIDDALPLSVLKVIEFADMTKMMVKFFRQILLAILLHDSEAICMRVFSRITQAENLELFRQSIKYFIYHFLLNHESKLAPDAASKLEERVKLVENTFVKTHLLI